MEFSGFRVQPLRIKGKSTKKRSKRRATTAAGVTSLSDQNRIDDAKQNYGFWTISSMSDFGPHVIAIEMYGAEGPGVYIVTNDNGSISIGRVSRVDDCDRDCDLRPEQQFHCIVCSDSKIAIKSGYGKYLGVERQFGQSGVKGDSDAVGPLQMWEPVFQEGRCALLGANQMFLTVDLHGDVRCEAERAEEREMIRIRTNRPLSVDPLASLPIEERCGLKSAEYNYVKKFQTWQDRRVRVNQEGSRGLKKAHRDQTLHECLLDRREKMKSDRYCK